MVGISGERASIEEGARRLMADVRQGIHYEARECLVLALGCGRSGEGGRAAMMERGRRAPDRVYSCPFTLNLYINKI
jgi:hypothetical protein